MALSIPPTTMRFTACPPPAARPMPPSTPTRAPQPTPPPATSQGNKALATTAGVGSILVGSVTVALGALVGLWLGILVAGVALSLALVASKYNPA